MKTSSMIRSWLIAAACVLSPWLASAQPSASYISFEVPGSKSTYPTTINNSLEVTGYYIGSDANTHGFVRTENEVITPFDVPGSTLTRPVAINDRGAIAGTCALGSLVGFVRSRSGSITTFNPGGPGGSTIVTAMNARGTVVGYYTNTNSSQNNAFVRYADGAITTFRIRGSDQVVPVSINPEGEITGYYQGGTQLAGFVRSPGGLITTFEYQEGIVPDAINARGTIAGYWADNNNGYEGFVRRTNGEIIPFSAPAGRVAGVVINDEGFIAGTYVILVPQLGGYVSHGFLRTPQGTISSFDPPGSMTSGVGSINDLGVIVGDYLDQNPNLPPYPHIWRGYLRVPIQHR